ncbi:MAG TPA: DUF4926 domain-containing protein [Phycisphaerales bacterium]|nr:DUF4926 domain-containing protein [Phycisphaerales bacterium]
MNTSPSIKLLDVVALAADLPAEGLVRGQVGTVVEQLAPGIVEVEFSDDDGHAYAMVAIPADQLITLFYSPTKAA